MAGVLGAGKKQGNIFKVWSVTVGVALCGAQVARTMAPSVIYIDEAEKVFVSDKKKKKEFQPYSEAFDRIKKLILKEVKKMAPGERVLLIGNSAAPQLCMKKDRKAFLNFWNKHLYVPVPDYASLRILWPALCSRHGGTLNYEFDLSTLCSISENYTSG
jgi:SpoVK/Ycf46/Vps4 family AAA+-type ATPase